MNNTSAQHYDRQLQAALAQIRHWGAVAVVGAGMSFAGYPMTAGLNPLLWQALDACDPARHATAHALGRPPARAKELVGDDWARLHLGYQQLRLHPQARAAFQHGFAALDSQRQPAPAHEAMARLMHHGFIELTVSFNWDTAVERAWAARYGTPLPTAAAQFIKPHGNAADPETDWILPDEPGLVPPPLADRVRAMLTERPRVLLIVGYSESDEDVVTQLTGPAGQQWPVVRIGPSATGPLAVTAPADNALPDLAAHLVPEPELPGWRWIDYRIQRDMGAALRGYRLTPQDTEACPQAPEVAAVAQRLTTADLARLQATSGCGKSVTAFQAARQLNHEGWEVVELAEAGVATPQTVHALAGTRYPTVAVVDDAQALPPALLTSLERLASSRLKILLVHTVDEQSMPADPATVQMLPGRTVHLLAEHISVHQHDLLPVLSQLDDRLGLRPFTTPVDERLKEARQASRPWQFMFVLTGGERRAADDVALLKEHDHADLLLAVLAAQQLLSLDAGTDQTTLILLASRSLQRSEDWAQRALAVLIERRLALPGEHTRTPHQRFAAHALRAVLRTEDQPDEQLLHHLRHQMCDRATTLGGIHWLLDDLSHVDQIRYGQRRLLDEETVQTLIDRCISAPRPERATAAIVLWDITRWGDAAQDQVLAHRTTIAHWIGEATAHEALPLHWTANGLRSTTRRESAWETTATQIPPLVFAHRLNAGLTAASAYSWAELLGELWQVVSEVWKQQCVAGLDRETLLACARDLSEYSVHGYIELATRCAEVDIDLYLALLDAAAPAISNLLTTKPGEALNNLFHFFLFTYWAGDGPQDDEPESDERRKFIASATSVVRRIIDDARWPQAAAVVNTGNVRSWQTLDSLGHWLHSHAPAAYEEFTAHIDLSSLDASTMGLWQDMDDLRPLLQALSCDPSREPGRSWITTHTDTIATMPNWAIAISPDAAAILAQNGRHLSLGLDGTFWDRSAEALQALTHVDRPAAVELLRRNRSAEALQALTHVDRPAAVELLRRNRPALTHALTDNQFHSPDGLGAFLQAADACDSNTVDAALAALEPAAVDRSWPALLEGTDPQRAAAQVLITRTAHVPGPVGDVARQLRPRLSASHRDQPASPDGTDADPQ
ncbi:hypothetical protein [Streptomyces sp. NPDC017940]|uniref:hypothetical protein n=1 Tax=Streptomyces sp. NPDC017940 TaxID=3365017 RepID=UPI0037A55A9C